MSNETYGFIKNGIVVNTAIFDNPSQELLNLFIQDYDLDDIKLGTDKIQVGGEYDGTKFWRKKPFESWVKNEELNEWLPPIDYPADGKTYIWNEEIPGWQLVTNENQE